MVKELNITCDLANNYKYKIVGNKNLKNGSIIYINIYKDNTKVSSYTITIEKEDNVSENTNISSETIDSTNEISSSNESTSPRKYESSTTISTTPIEFETSTDMENTDNNNTTTESSTEVTVVDVPNTYKKANIITYIISSILFISAIYIINKYRNSYK